MLSIILALLPKVGSAVAALPEFARLIHSVKDTLGSNDQQILQNAYQLALVDSVEAHNDLQALVAQHVAR